MPWAPVGGTRGVSSAELEKFAKDHGITIYQLGLAWLLHRSPVMLPIPGTSSLKHLEENMAARKIQFSPEEWKTIDALTNKA
jgi:aryl-alcohol dehydrogenase-like predicted oxidoreductase